MKAAWSEGKSTYSFLKTIISLSRQLDSPTKQCCKDPTASKKMRLQLSGMRSINCIKSGELLESLHVCGEYVCLAVILE